MKKQEIINVLIKHQTEEKNSTGTTGDYIIYNESFEDVADDLIKLKDLLPDGVQTKQQKLQYIKDIGLFKHLQHHKDTTVGLYAFDQKIEDIFDEILGLKCETVTEQLMMDKILYLKSIVFRISDNLDN